MMFGSSGKKQWEDAPEIERFTWRINESATSYSRWYKSIVRLNDPGLNTQGSEHLFQTILGTYDEKGMPLTTEKSRHRSSLLRINHYFTKSRAEWKQRHPIDKTGETIPRKEKRWSSVQSMDVDDRTILRFLPELKERMK